MDRPPVKPTDGRVLVLAPVGRDAPLAARVLGQSGIATHACLDMAALCEEVGRGAAAVLLAEEALTPPATQQLLDTLGRQPPWSDLPLVVLTARRGGTPDRLRVLRRFEQLRNVTFLERPARVMTLVSAVRAAVDARRRQYQVRDLLAESEERVRQREDLLATLGHELRNPLAPLRYALEVLAGRGDDPKTWEWVRGVFARQVTHLSRIVDDVLEVSRISRGKVELRRERLDLAALVRWIVEDHAPAFAAKGVALAHEPPAGPVWVDADATRLTQVVGNLLHNACKFTDRGGSVSVRLEPDSAADRVWVAVRDTGIGLDPAVLPHVFEPFVQARQNLDRGRGGLGLGLAMVEGLVRLHGGEVRAASAGLGQGSEFRFCLPLAPAPASAHPTADRPRAAGLRVLIVEDHPDAAESLRLLLELDGYQVCVATTGPGGVEAATRFRPDVVLCDLGLPELDGYGVVAALRRHPATAAVPVVALSGYAQDEDRQRCREAGFAAHLAKPVDPDDLRKFLARLGAGHRPNVPSHPAPDFAACGAGT
jgi:signal transduction histidine kinase/ActR/RegA family two-component response regulator